MPDWMIKIERKNQRRRKASRLSRIDFTPNPQEALAGDVINWKNTDTEPHWPAPFDEYGKLNKTGYMTHKIPPGATSDIGFSPDAADKGKELEYGCVLHPGEKGIIKVLLSPPVLVLRSLLFVTLAVLLQPLPVYAEGSFVPCPEPGALPLYKMPEITRDPAKKTLQAVITVRDEERLVWFRSGDEPGAPAFCAPQRLRFFTGPASSNNSQSAPTAQGLPEPVPGPTLRARVGDWVNITFLNHVDVNNFQGSLDRGDQGLGCDQVKSQDPYPAKNNEMPNCLHGSSTANLHFHGLHVTPNTTGDNVLLMIRPSPRDPKGNPQVTEASVKDVFKRVFDKCEAKSPPKHWEELPAEWRKKQETLLRKYDETGPYQGKYRPLPEAAQLWPRNKMAIEHGLWPQYQMGAYPYCFNIPEYKEKNGKPEGVRMGQAPGTYWYHAHKHGSSALNVANGMAGAFIIEGEYDDTLRAFYKPKGGLTEQVLVIQQIGVSSSLIAPPGPTRPLLSINGRRQPVIEMKPGEVQLWRFVNAAWVSGVQFFDPKSYDPKNTTEWRQTARDGIQLSPENYARAAKDNPPFLLSPGNRVDLLVKAPAVAGRYDLRFADAISTNTPQDKVNDPILLTIQVSAAPSVDMPFPSKEDFPKLPSFLEDIAPETIHISREVTFNTKVTPVEGKAALRDETIDDRLFKDQTISQSMLQDTAEEWTLLNTTLPPPGVAHPFHIHVNPFQVIEVFDPNDPREQGANCYKAEDPSTWKSCQPPLEKPYVWRDTIAIPAARQMGEVVVPGHVKMRTRFDDFPGLFVLHCHILIHEDHGMMQLIQVVPNNVMIKHH
ncbi:multicopper oxidase domain-containing protein [Cystobacter fuscus]|uniref:multicopper oxidase domain-containing protein n=1 Tax=Cystobacter fuscus TaxID=43 RepID=UPI002B2C9517|nr:multicopper oxidase domain-containing protein [Cystobacter fuscus]